MLARRRRAVGRVSLIGLGVVFFSAGGVAAVTALEGRWPGAPFLGRWPAADGWFDVARTRTREAISSLTRRASAAPVPIYASPVVTDSVTLTDSVHGVARADPVLAALNEALRQAQDSAAGVAAVPPLKPIVGEGRTPLRDGLVAVRTGDTVAVHFDTPLLRTRQTQKFEQLVRATLPAIYGAAVDSLLATVAAGELIRGVDPTAQTATHGVYLPLAGGWSLALWPETRPGRDGPLIITYRTALTR
ncbi:MAG: hypothetical protein ABR499_12540 [Gemmatimonadaceae bacterium]